MSNPFKTILSIVASLLFLTAVTIISLPFLIDPNDFKAQIETTVSENTGRTLSVEGDLELSIFPWLGISTGKLSLANAEGFAGLPFAQIVESNIKIKLLPLLFKEIEVSEIVLKGLELNLQKNAQGQTNWADLAALLSKDNKTNPNPLKLLQIAGLSIQSANISWDNQQTGQVLTLKDVNLSTEKFAFDAPMETTFDFTLYNKQPALTETVSMQADLSVDEALSRLKLAHLKLNVLSEGKVIPSEKLKVIIAAELAVNLDRQQVNLSALTVKTGDLQIEATVLAQLTAPFKMTSAVHISNFNAARFVKKQLRLSLPVMADERALSWVGANFTLQATEQQAIVDNLTLQVDQTTLRGKVHLHDFTTPRLDFKLALDILNADRYLSPPSAVVKSPANTTALTIDTELLPLDTLRKWDVTGELTISDLKINNLTMQGIRFVLDAKQGLVESQQSVENLYHGAYKSKFAVDMRAPLPNFAFEQRLAHIQLGALLTDLQGETKINGVMDLSAQLAGTGNTERAVKSSLNGRLSVLFKNAVIQGVNLQTIMDNRTISFKEPELDADTSKEFTAFSKIAATAIIGDGFVRNNDLSANAARIKVSGFGYLNLLSEQLNYKLITLLLKEKLAQVQTKAVHHLPLFVNIGGTFKEPLYELDLAEMGLAF